MTDQIETIVDQVATQLADLADRYLEIWNETDPETRRELITRTWTTDAEYLDPLLSGNGHDGINDMIVGLQTAYPNHQFSRIGDVDHHHDRIRFRWQMTTPEGDISLLGTDFGILTDEGLLLSITGFFDNV